MAGATSAELDYPDKAIPDASGNVYIADYYNCAVRKVTASTGKISTFAGSSSLGCGYSGDGGAATSAELYSPHAVAVDGSGNVCVADGYNCAIRKVTKSTGVIQ